MNIKDTLIIHIKKEYFDMLANEEKHFDYREYKPYWQTRLSGIIFNYILFVNGYKKDSPKLKCYYKGLYVLTYNELPCYVKKEFKEQGSNKLYFAIWIEKV